MTSKQRSKSATRLIFRFREISLLLCAFLLLQNLAASAEALLDSKFAQATSHDFVSYFGFAQKKLAKETPGTTSHFYYSPNWTCSLILTVNDKDGKVVHMKLGVPRPLFDDEKVTSRGRDIVKSFIMASAIGADIGNLKELADEVYVRGLDLQPIGTPQSKNFADTGKPVPHLQAYKIGKGPLSNGDNAIFLSQLPKLGKEPSPLFKVISGKSDSLGRVYRNCRLAFLNEDMKVTHSPIQLLWCESWDEPFFQSIQIAAAKAKANPRKTEPTTSSYKTNPFGQPHGGN